MFGRLWSTKSRSLPASAIPLSSMLISPSTTTVRSNICLIFLCPHCVDAGIRAYPDSASPNTLAQTFEHGLNQAILRYKGARSLEPTTTNSSTMPLLESNLHPLKPIPVPGQHSAGGADETLTLNIEFVRPATGLIRRVLC